MPCRSHVGRPRQVKPGQLIHESVFDKIDRDSYFPKACLYGDFHWNGLKKLKETMIEEDPFTKVAGILDELQNSIFDVTDQRLDMLLTIINSSELCIPVWLVSLHKADLQLHRDWKTDCL
jgi:hypothetical protein